MRDEDRVRIQHMIDSIESIQRFVKGREEKDLGSDEMLLFAIVRAIEILGEAAGKIGDDTRTRAPSVPWSAIVAMRNRLIHGYFDIDTEIVWKTVTIELPAIEPALRALLGEVPSNSV